MNNSIIEIMDMIKMEFIEIDYDRLRVIVKRLIVIIGSDKFFAMSRVDQYDFLVDSIMCRRIDNIWLA